VTSCQEITAAHQVEVAPVWGSTEDFVPGKQTAHVDTTTEQSLPAVAVPDYEILGVLGRGGMGVVYKAVHRPLKRLVALKMVLAGGHASPHELARFRIEAEAVARLQHPNIVQVHEVGTADGHPYQALEFIEGKSLDELLEDRTMPAREAARLMETLSRAMQLAHSRNVVHRDLKPANILLAADGTPKITDFGLARQLDSASGQTQTGMVMGTPSYMAPEQAAGRTHEAGPAADVYALGAILYDCLTGRPPFKGNTLLDTLDQVRNKEPMPPSHWQADVPLDLETICLKCLRKEPENRYASAAELADELGRFLRGEPILARPVGRFERTWRWCRRNPRVAGLTAATVIALLGGTIFSLTMAFIANDRANKIEAINLELERANEAKSQATLEAQEQARIAQEQRQLAYKTLESVVFDIQTKLAAVPNAQQVRGDLLKTALQGLERLSAQLRADKRVNRSTAVATLHLAEVFRQISNETGTQSRANANLLYERALAIFEELHRAAPQDAVAQRDLAEACLLFAINLSRTDDLGANVTAEMVAAQKERPLLVRAGFLGQRAIDLRRRLLAATPGDRAAQYEVARALAEWAYQQMRSGDAAAAQRALLEACGLLKELLAAHPSEISYRFLFGRAASRLGDYFYDLVKDGHEQAAPFYEESLAVLKRLATEQPQDQDIQMEYANAWSRMGDLYAARRQYEKSLEAFQKELAVTQALEKLAPNNMQTMSDASISYDHVSRELLRLERYTEALPVLVRVLEIRQGLIAVDPDNRRHHAQLLRPVKRLGLVYEKLGQPDKALETYERGLRLLTAYRTRTTDHSLDEHITALQTEAHKHKSIPVPPK
jgi:serine/threonine-protein kinase